MDIQKKTTLLPLAQQIALFVILRMPEAEKPNFSFLSSDLAKALKPFIKNQISYNKKNYGNFIGGILSSLNRNEILTKITGDRDKLWTLSNEVKANMDDYKNSLFKIKIYWKK